jgi:hypothetical protein
LERGIEVRKHFAGVLAGDKEGLEKSPVSRARKSADARLFVELKPQGRTAGSLSVAQGPAEIRVVGHLTMQDETCDCQERHYDDQDEQWRANFC